jgi:3',5'-cyclic AMP phosphodiesterase CpdA
MITVAHLSDIHLAPLPPIRPAQLLNKRLTGYINWRLKRHTSQGGSGLAQLVDHLHEQDADFTAVTGDLINLGLDAEIAHAASWLNGLGPAERVAVSPGNHDAYLPGTLTRACEAWRPYVTGETIDDNFFPFVRRIGDVAIVCCSSAVATPPFVSAGRFDRGQAGRLGRILHMLGEGGYFRVVMIHHPPGKEGDRLKSGLWGVKLFRQAIAEYGAELILHGHTHRSTQNSLPGPVGAVPVIGVAAASNDPEANRSTDPARYNLFHIERRLTGWTCNMGEFGFQRLGGEITLRQQLRIY